jgi:uncharacterized protein (DUF58 family)
MAVSVALVGALITVLFGMPEVGLFVAPWMVLAVMGMGQNRSPKISVQLAVAQDRLLESDEAQVGVTVTSSEDGTVRLQPAPTSTFGLGADQAAELALTNSVIAGQPSVSDFAFPADEWGTHDLGRINVNFTSRYGLFSMTGAAEGRHVVRVHPTPTRLREVLTPWLVRRVSGLHHSRESARGIEYADIRPFTTGDAVRDINWRASARSDQLWTTQRHPDRATDVVLLVDSFVESGHDVREVFGLILDASVALSENHLGATDRVGMIEFGGVVRWVAPATGRVQLQRLTDALLATGLWANAATKELPVLSPRALPPRSFVIALTPLLDERFIDAIFTARGRGHDVAVIECLPPADDGTDVAILNATDKSTDAAERIDQIHRVAESLWTAERDALRDRLAGHGVAVAQWDGTVPLDVALGQLLQLRRGVRVRQR